MCSAEFVIRGDVRENFSASDVVRRSLLRISSSVLQADHQRSAERIVVHSGGADFLVGASHGGGWEQGERHLAARRGMRR